MRIIEHTIQLNTYAEESLGARVLGINIKKDAIAILKNEPEAKIIFDFSGIKYISTGFAKELFGGLLQDLGDTFKTKIQIRTQNDNEIIKDIILKALKSTLKY